MTRQYLIISTLWLSACSPATSGNAARKAEDSGEVPIVDCEDGDRVTYWEDSDGDGFGNPDRSEPLCGAEDGWVDNSDDCDDSNLEISPTQDERCDGVDNNCDGLVDDDTAIDANDWFRDGDGDGFGGGPPRGFGCSGAENEVSNSEDCNDDDSAIHPDAVEVCDAVDNDCDGAIDNGETADGHPVYEDIDDDGWGNEASELIRCITPEGWVDRSGDCDDDDVSRNPDATDECDGFDMDCDGHIDSHCATTVDADVGWILHLEEGAAVISMHISDIDGDGTNDLLAFDLENNKALFFAGPLTGTETAPDHTISHSDFSDDPDSSTSRAFGLAIQGDVDFNGDGHADLLISTPESGSSDITNFVGLYLGPDWLEMDPADPDVALTSTLGTATWGQYGLPSGDLTGDGQPDVVVTSSESTLVIWDNPLEDATFEDLTVLDTIERTENMIPVISDLNSDGLADLVVSTGDILAIRHGPISPSALTPVPDVTISASLDTFVGDGLCAADLTGDGAMDLAYTENSLSGEDDDINQVHLMDLASDESSPFWTAEFSASGPTVRLLCDDIDGDGRADLQVNDYFHSDSFFLGGEVHIFFGSLESGVVSPDQSIAGTSAGAAIGLSSASGDLDGDGVGDVVLSGLGSLLYIHRGDSWVSDEWVPAE